MRFQGPGCGPLVFLGGGIVLFLAGILLAFAVPVMMNQQADRVERMTPLSAVILDDSAPGRVVLVEGQISDRNATQYRSFVAYRFEERVRDADGDYTWRTRSTVTPPLLIDLPDGRIQVSEGYSLNNLPNDNTIRERNDRYKGLVAGDEVVIIGTVVDGLELPEISADFVASGTQQEYVDNQRTGAWIALFVGVMISAVGLRLATVGLVQVVRR